MIVRRLKILLASPELVTMASKASQRVALMFLSKRASLLPHSLMDPHSQRNLVQHILTKFYDTTSASMAPTGFSIVFCFRASSSEKVEN